MKVRISPWLLILFFVLLATAIIYLLGSGQMNSNRVNQIYFADNISPAHQKLIEKFNAEYRGEIEVVPVNLPFSKFSTNERKELLARSLRSRNDLIDIFAVDLIWVPRFAKWCLPLDIHLDQEVLSKIIPEAMQSCVYEDQVVASPLYIDIGVMYYRQDIVANFPNAGEIEKRLKQSITWEELIHLERNYNRNERPFYIFAAKNYEGLICSFFELLYHQNGNIFTADSIQLNTLEARKALNFLTELVNEYQMTPQIVTGFDEYQSYIYTLKNDAVFLRGWPGFLKHYRYEIEDTTKIDLFDIAAVPHFKGSRPGSVFGGWNLMISRYTKKKWDALKFLQFTLRPENQKILYREGGYIPIHSGVYQDSSFLKKHPDLGYYKQLLQRGFHRPYLEEYTKISDIISYYAHLAIKDEMSPEAALRQATQRINSDRIIIN